MKAVVKAVMKKMGWLVCLVFFLLGCSTVAKREAATAAEYDPDSSLALDIGGKTVALMNRAEMYPDGTEDGVARPYCTGVWVSPDMVLTAGHCVEAMKGTGKAVGTKINISVKDQISNIGENPSGEFAGKVVGYAKKYDLALVSVPGTGVHGVASVVPTSPGVGSRIYSMGHVKGLYWTYAEGVISSYRMKMKSMGIDDFEGPFLQVSAPIYLGNSGGGVFDGAGRLVGICSFVASAPNVGFYIPAAHVREFLRSNGIK